MSVRRFGYLLLGACLVLQGCATIAGRAQVVRIREVVGTIEVATAGDQEVVSTDTDRGLEILSQGAMMRLPEGARIRLEFLHRKGVVYFFGPGELELTEVRLLKGEGGVHASAQEVHATLAMRGGVLAGAMEGKLEERPSLEVVTPRGATRLEATGKFAVLIGGDPEWNEAWVRDERGPDELRILLGNGVAVPFPTNGVLLMNAEDEITGEAADTAERSFTRAFLEALTVDPRPLPEFSRLVDALRWKSMSNL